MKLTADEKRLVDYAKLKVLEYSKMRKSKGLLRFSNFRDLFSFIPKKNLAHESLTLDEQIKRIRYYYSKEKEEQYGVLAIWFEVI